MDPDSCITPSVSLIAFILCSKLEIETTKMQTVRVEQASRPSALETLAHPAIANAGHPFAPPNVVGAGEPGRLQPIGSKAFQIRREIRSHPSRFAPRDGFLELGFLPADACISAFICGYELISLTDVCKMLLKRQAPAIVLPASPSAACKAFQIRIPNRSHPSRFSASNCGYELISLLDVLKHKMLLKWQAPAILLPASPSTGCKAVLIRAAVPRSTCPSRFCARIKQHLLKPVVPRTCIKMWSKHQVKASAMLLPNTMNDDTHHQRCIRLAGWLSSLISVQKLRMVRVLLLSDEKQMCKTSLAQQSAACRFRLRRSFVISSSRLRSPLHRVRRKAAGTGKASIAVGSLKFRKHQHLSMCKTSLTQQSAVCRFRLWRSFVISSSRLRLPSRRVRRKTLGTGRASIAVGSLRFRKHQNPSICLRVGEAQAPKSQCCAFTRRSSIDMASSGLCRLLLTAELQFMCFKLNFSFLPLFLCSPPQFRMHSAYLATQEEVPQVDFITRPLTGWKSGAAKACLRPPASPALDAQVMVSRRVPLLRWQTAPCTLVPAHCLFKNSMTIWKGMARPTAATAGSLAHCPTSLTPRPVTPVSTLQQHDGLSMVWCDHAVLGWPPIKVSECNLSLHLLPVSQSALSQAVRSPAASGSLEPVPQLVSQELRPLPLTQSLHLVLRSQSALSQAVPALIVECSLEPILLVAAAPRRFESSSRSFGSGPEARLGPWLRFGCKAILCRALPVVCGQHPSSGTRLRTCGFASWQLAARLRIGSQRCLLEPCCDTALLLSSAVRKPIHSAQLHPVRFGPMPTSLAVLTVNPPVKRPQTNGVLWLGRDRSSPQGMAEQGWPQLRFPASEGCQALALTSGKMPLMHSLAARHFREVQLRSASPMPTAKRTATPCRIAQWLNVEVWNGNAWKCGFFATFSRLVECLYVGRSALSTSWRHSDRVRRQLSDLPLQLVPSWRSPRCLCTMQVLGTVCAARFPLFAALCLLAFLFKSSVKLGSVELRPLPLMRSLAARSFCEDQVRSPDLASTIVLRSSVKLVSDELRKLPFTQSLHLVLRNQSALSQAVPAPTVVWPLEPILLVTAASRRFESSSRSFQSGPEARLGAWLRFGCKAILCRALPFVCGQHPSSGTRLRTCGFASWQLAARLRIGSQRCLLEPCCDLAFLLGSAVRKPIHSAQLHPVRFGPMPTSLAVLTVNPPVKRPQTNGVLWLGGCEALGTKSHRTWTLRLLQRSGLSALMASLRSRSSPQGMAEQGWPQLSLPASEDCQALALTSGKMPLMHSLAARHFREVQLRSASPMLTAKRAANPSWIAQWLNVEAWRSAFGTTWRLRRRLSHLPLELVRSWRSPRSLGTG